MNPAGTSAPLPRPLYARVLGPAFARLPAPVQAMHAFTADAHVAGRGSVRRGGNLLARLVGWAFRFPPAEEDVPVAVTFTLDEVGETWWRDFAGRRFRSRLSSRDKDGHTILTETFWPFTFDFDLHAHEAGLEMEIRAWRMLGLPLPRRLAPQISAHERVAYGRFTFDVRIALPRGVLGGPLVVHYTGWLES